MRWEFIDPPTPEDVRQRQLALEGIDRWWAEFQARSQAIDEYFSQGCAFDIPGFMQEHLHAISPELMWEYGPAVEKEGHRLVITPEAHKELRPLLTTLLERAPDLPRWEFYGYRLPDPTGVEGMIEARTRRKSEGLRGRAALGSNHRIDVTFCCPGYSDSDALFHAAFVACETLFGEEMLDTWIGGIEPWVEDPGEEDGWLSMLELLQEVNRLRDEILDGLSARPCHAFHNETEWTMFKLKPKAADDYPGQTDLFVAKTMLVEMWRTAHGGALFSSSRFSRAGETFCYLKLDGREGLDEEGFADKSEIENAINAALVPKGLGCHIGGGTGNFYSYIDLALTDVPRAVEVIKSVLREGTVPVRSWILFFDEVYQDEWIGIWDETPPPPVAAG